MFCHHRMTKRRLSLEESPLEEGTSSVSCSFLELLAWEPFIVRNMSFSTHVSLAQNTQYPVRYLTSYMMNSKLSKNIIQSPSWKCMNLKIYIISFARFSKFLDSYSGQLHLLGTRSCFQLPAQKHDSWGCSLSCLPPSFSPLNPVSLQLLLQLLDPFYNLSPWESCL